MAVEFLGGIAATIGGFMFVPTGRHFGYLINYNSNLHNFQNKVDELQAPRNRTQRLVNEAKTRGDVIREDVDSWLKQVDGITEDSDNLSNEANENGRCFNQLCPNLKTRYKVSKRAKEKTVVVVGLLTNRNFSQVFDRAPLQQGSRCGNNLVVFESRKSNFENIVKALRDDNISIIGVHGTSGIGKTTIVKEVEKHVREQHLFENVVWTVVSQKPDVRKIQGEIADALRIKLEEESENGRADRLWQVLKKIKSVLVILDDLWEVLNLDDIGIPHGNVDNGWKIVLTSRNQDVCDRMLAHEKISINILSQEDARNLFRTTAGDAVDSPEINPIASKIVEECAGLPIAIVTVALALVGKSSYDLWNDALNQLQNCRAENIPGVDKIVYRSLKYSYDFLESDDFRYCFLLCCLFEEDADISIGQLVRYGRGLKLFQSVRNLKEARERAHALVDHLKTRSLLLDGKDDESIKMHDVLRDFAIREASSSNVFWVTHDATLTEWTNENTVDKYTGISFLSNNITELPEGLDCPKLKILVLECRSDTMKIPGNFFEGMKELRVLDMRHMPIPSLSPLVQALKKLRTLCLHRCKLKEISLIGELKDLEVLSFGGSNVGQLPKEIGELTKLRLLDLTDCKELIIPAKVISKLRLLECLYMRNTFVRWAGEGQDMGESNANFAELKFLSNLFDLEIHIPDVKIFPKDLFFENLIRFKVSIGNMHFGPWYTSYPKSLELRLHQGFTIQEGIKKLLKRAQQLILNHDPDVSIHVLRDLNREGFANLKCLEVYGNDQIQHLVDTKGCLSGSLFPILEKLMVENMGNLKEICHGDHLPAGSFSKLGELTLLDLPELINLWKDPTGHACLHNLRILRVKNCDKLKSIFPQQVARYLGQLHHLEVNHCANLEEVFADNRDAVGEAGMDQIVLHELKTLHLRRLRNLRSFCSETDDSLTSQQPIFNGKVVFPAVKTLHLVELGNVKEIWHRQLPTESFCSLTYLKIERCNSIVTVLPSNMLPRLQNLESLHVENCELVEEVCEDEGLVVDDRHNNDATSSLRLLLPRITDVNLGDLPRLKHMWYNKPRSPLLGYSLSLQNLSTMEIYKCDGLRYLFSLSASKSLVQLQSLVITSCGMITEVIATERGNIEEEASRTIEFPSLKVLEIQDCLQMKTFIASAFTEKVEEERNLGVIIQSFFSEKVTFPKLENLYMNGLNELVEMCPNHFPENTFCNLQELHVKNCEKLLHVGLTNVVPRLCMLEKLCIEKCGSEEEPFVSQGPVFDRAVVFFSNLRELRLWRMPMFWQRWWDKVLHGILYFQNLSSLEIFGFDNLSYVFPSSAARQLGQLQTLKIHSCELVEEIVAVDSLGEEEPTDVIVFPQLEVLELEHFPKLMRFYSKSCTFEWPCLVKLRIVKCPKMKTFAPIPSQQNLRTDIKEGSEETLEELCTLPIQPFFNEKVTFPKLENLYMDGLNELVEMCPNHLPKNTFCNLWQLHVKNCKKLLHVGLTNVLPRLRKLENLCIENFSVKDWLSISRGPVFTKDRRVGSLFNREVRLRWIPMSWQREWDKVLHGILYFQNLSSLEISGLDNLSYVFSCSAARHLGQLRTLEIHSCELVEEIVAVDSLGEEEPMEVIVFPRLEVLELGRLPKVMRFYSKSCTFEWPCLTKLRIVKCPKMKTFAPIPSQQNLRTDIKEGSEETLEELCTLPIQPFFNEKVTFPKLENLYMDGLNELVEMCPNHLPKNTFCNLWQLHVKNCKKLLHVGLTNVLPRLRKLENLCIENFSVKDWLSISRGPVFTKDRRVGSLFNREVRLRWIPMSWQREWDKVLHGILYFQNLSSLEISGLDNLSYVFSCSAARHLGQLRTLEIHSCELVEEIVAVDSLGEEEPMEVIVFPRLEVLELGRLPKVMRFYSKSCTFEWPCLTKLRIVKCPKMKTFAPIPSQQNLRTDIKEGSEETLEELCTLPIQPFFNEKVTFPKLENLCMDGLNELVEMCPNHLPKNTFCNLRQLHVVNCEKLLHVGLTNLLPRLRKLEKLYIEKCSLEEEPFIPQVPAAAASLSNLREVRLKSTPRLWQRLWDKVLHGILRFQNLSLVEISGFDTLNYLFPSSAARGLVQLQELKIQSCKLVREIVAIDGLGEEEPAEDMTVFPKLETLELKDLPNITSFFSGSCTMFKWPYLSELVIANCPKMKTFPTILSQQNPTNDEEGSKKILAHPTQPFFNEKVFLPSLRELEIDSQPRLKEIWHNHLPADQSFSQLRRLEVKNCEKLVRVFPSSLLPRLQSLDELRIEHCDSLETVLEGGVDPTEKVVFPLLDTLSLVHLSNLGSFCWGNHSIECPVLDTVSVEDCPNMRTFSSGLLITPPLNEVEAGDGKPSLPWKGDLNSTIQHFFKEKVKAGKQEETEEEETSTAHEKTGKQEETEEEETSTAQVIHSEILEETKD